MIEKEYFFTCPHCWQEISVLLDLSVRGQRYVEDCEVCCHPLEIWYESDGEGVVGFAVRPAQE